jgi:aminoglycoside 6'-N-acetyltransferase
VELTALKDGELELRPIEEGDLEGLIEIITEPSVGRWWGDTNDREKLRRDILCDDEDDAGAFAIEVEGELAGWLGVWEENEPDYRHGGVDIMLAADHQDRGIGPRALRMAIDWLIEARGHHRVTIDPAAANERAIHAYEKVGFRPVGIMRKYGRGADGDWHDGLLMDLLAEELER